MNLSGVELMTIGDPDGRGIDFTVSDLTAIANSFSALNLAGRVPLKFGHNDEQPLTDGQPALGWVSRLWVEGAKLLADFVDLPKVVYDAVKQGLYKFVSVELLRNVRAGTRELPWVLDAVALLGADQPAFGTLRDLQSLTLRRRPAWRAESRYSFTRHTFNVKPEGDEMDEKQVQELINKAITKERETFATELDKAKKEGDKRLSEEQAARKADQIKFRRTQITERFNVDIRAGKLEPAAFTKFESWFRLKDDVAVESITDAQVEEFVKDHAKTPPAKKGGAGNDGHIDEERGKPATDVVAARSKALCYQRNQDPKNFVHLNQAVIDTLKADATLAEAYKFMQPYEPKVA